MDYNLETLKGSCGYAAPGQQGVPGRNGNSIHFSSIDTSTNITLVKDRIVNKHSLTDNTEAITEEKYKANDYILDTYGQLCVITTIEPGAVIIERVGNIAFPEKENGYQVPVDSSTQKSELFFKLSNSMHYPPYTPYIENSFILRNRQLTPIENAWKLWRYRYYGHITYITMPAGSFLNIPRGYICEPDNNRTLKWKTDTGDSSTFQSTKAFIEYVIDNEEYCKICAVLNNGLVIESIPTHNNMYIFIEKGYIESIDKNLTGLSVYSTFIDELSAQSNADKIKDCIKSGKINTMCNMYFEYSHKGEIYRMKINVT